MADELPIARHGDIDCRLLPALANFRGLTTGAIGNRMTIPLVRWSGTSAASGFRC